MEITLRCVFGGAGDKKITMTWGSADQTASAAQIKALMQVIVSNGEIFAEVPTSIIGAEFVARQVTPINVS